MTQLLISGNYPTIAGYLSPPKQLFIFSIKHKHSVVLHVARTIISGVFVIRISRIPYTAVYVCGLKHSGNRTIDITNGQVVFFLFFSVDTATLIIFINGGCDKAAINNITWKSICWLQQERN